MSNLNSCSAECWGTKLSHLMLFRLNQTLNLHSGPLQKATYSTQMSHLEVPSIVLGTLLFAGASLKLAGRTRRLPQGSTSRLPLFNGSARLAWACLAQTRFGCHKEIGEHVQFHAFGEYAQSFLCRWWLTRQINSIIKLQHST